MRSFCAKMRSAKTLTGCSSSAHCPESLWIVQGHVVLHYQKGGYFKPLRAFPEAETFISWHCSHRRLRRRLHMVGACVGSCGMIRQAFLQQPQTSKPLGVSSLQQGMPATAQWVTSHFTQCIYKLYGMCVEVRRAYVERRETSSLDALTRPSMESGSDVEVRRATASRRRAFASSFASRKRREVEAGAQSRSSLLQAQQLQRSTTMER